MKWAETAKNAKLALPTKSKLKKDPGIPKLPDLKVRNAGKQRMMNRRPELRLVSDPDTQMSSEPSLSTLSAQAFVSLQDEARVADGHSGSTTTKTKEQLRRHYVRALHEVINQSDIIVLVLDARDPEGCRSRLVEEEVRRRENEGKKLVFVLNKIDLVPRANAQAWLRHLRHSTPTLPFRSASSNQRSNLSSSTAPSLLRLLKAYKPSAAQSVTVGVVGYPNVGKSSLINTLKRAKVCAVAAQPGHTKTLQRIQLERGLKIVDSPGVIFDDEDELDKTRERRKKGSILLRNVVRLEDVQDPIEVVEEILARTGDAVLRGIYNLPLGEGSTLEFLTMLALSSGKLLKGGTPDLLSAARQVLTDWNHQKIPYLSEPPSVHPSLIPSILPTSSSAEDAPMIAPGAEDVGKAQILNALSKPFELDGLFVGADAGAFGCAGGGEDEVMADVDEAGTGDAMDEDDEHGRVVPRKRARSPSEVSSATVPPSTVSSLGPIHRLDPGVAFKGELPSHALRHEAKRRRKSEKKALSDGMSPAETMGALSRKVLKRNAKAARRAAGRARKAALGMDIDGEDGLDGLEFFA